MCNGMACYFGTGIPSWQKDLRVIELCPVARSQERARYSAPLTQHDKGRNSTLVNRSSLVINHIADCIQTPILHANSRPTFFFLFRPVNIDGHSTSFCSSLDINPSIIISSHCLDYSIDHAILWLAESNRYDISTTRRCRGAVIRVSRISDVRWPNR